MENNGNDRETQIARLSAMRAASEIVAGYARGKEADSSTWANMAIEIAEGLFAWTQGCVYVQGTEPQKATVTQGVAQPPQKTVPAQTLPQATNGQNQPVETRVPEPKNAEQTAEQVMDFVSSVSLPKKGINKNGESFERYVIILHGGTILNTFSQTEAQLAREAQSKGAMVCVRFVRNDKFKQQNILSIKEQPVA